MLQIDFDESTGLGMLYVAGTGQGSLAGRAYGLILRRVKTARKQSKRGVKLAQNVFRRVRQAEKTLFFRLRDSETGRMLLKAAGLAGSPRDMRHRAQAAAPYIARLGNHGADIDPAKGYCLLSPDRLGDFSQVLASCRQLFAIKKAEIDAQLTGYEGWTPEQQQKFLTRKQSFLRYLLDDDDLRRHPELVNFALGDTMLGSATRYLGVVPHLTRIDLMVLVAAHRRCEEHRKPTVPPGSRGFDPDQALHSRVRRWRTRRTFHVHSSRCHRTYRARRSDASQTAEVRALHVLEHMAEDDVVEGPARLVLLQQTAGDVDARMTLAQLATERLGTIDTREIVEVGDERRRGQPLRRSQFQAGAGPPVAGEDPHAMRDGG